MGCLTDGETGVLWWSALAGLVVLYWMLPIFTEYEMSNVSNVWTIISTFVELPRMFLSTDFLFELRIGLLCIITGSVSGLATDSP